MTTENYSESDTRAKLITPSLLRRNWTEDMIRREETAGAILMDEQGAYRSDKKRIMDYVLRVIPKEGAQQVAVALVEAKSNDKSPGAGLEQARHYRRLVHVPFAYSTNGYRFVEYDHSTGKTSDARDMAHFPTPDDLRRRYEEYVGFGLDEECAKPLITPYVEGEGGRRYYQDAAIRAALEKIAADEKTNKPPRVLLSLATGAGKTFIATHLLKRLRDAGRMRRALFLCDRDALRGQALDDFVDIFGNDAAAVRRGKDGENEAKYARVHIATYQTLGISGDKADDDNQSFAMEHYPPDHFSHIIIDECHRSAWGKWSEILDRNPKAAQIGLTATPRKIGGDESGEDKQISADNHRHFGEPVYSYSLSQGGADGYLARCNISTANVSLDNTGILRDELIQHNPEDYKSGEMLAEEQLKDAYQGQHFDNKLILPDRINAMCGHLFDNLIANGGGDPRQKTIIFCASDIHAREVATKMNNLYADWCGKRGEKIADPYAFRCTADSEGNKVLPDFKGNDGNYFVATTVELLTTGVNITRLRNIVFFKYVSSPIALHQMIGRGARIDEENNKLAFSVYDYTDATSLLGKDDWQPPKGGGGKRRRIMPEQKPMPLAGGFVVHIADTGDYVGWEEEDGTQTRISTEEYRKRLASRLLQRIQSADHLRAEWVDTKKRAALLKFLAEDKAAPHVLGRLLAKGEYDDYDILAESAFGVMSRTRKERAEAFDGKNQEWLKAFEQAPHKTILALARLFALGGIEELESDEVFNANSVEDAGGFDALQSVSGATPKALLDEIKKRLFAA
ncbi:MAG: DEAD/DEAH box helicase family protein [Gammaproteobacteria bacterium]